MNFAVILAGGAGVRVKSATMPKQFLALNGKTVLQLTVTKFLLCKNIHKVVVAVPRAWIGHTEDLFKADYYSNYNKIDICSAGAARQETLYNALKYIESTYPVSEEDLAVSHDAVRPFVSTRIIEDNIAAGVKFGAADTVIPATDTVIVSNDGHWIDVIPQRATLFQGQTPQTFKIKTFLSCYEKMDAEHLAKTTDAAGILSEHNVPVALVRGEEFNIKLTTDYDFGLAKFILDGIDHD